MAPRVGVVQRIANVVMPNFLAPRPPEPAEQGGEPIFKPGELVEGAQVEYKSASNQCWMPCVVIKVDPDTGGVTLNVKPERPLGFEEQQLKLRPRSRPKRRQLEWVRAVLREGRIEDEAKAIFRRYSVRRPGDSVLEDLLAAASELDTKLGISGCLCTLRQYEEQQESPPQQGGLFVGAFCEAFWDLLWVVQRDFCLALPSDGLAEPACGDDPRKVYNLERQLGQGSYGTVSLATSRATGAKYAVKQIMKVTSRANYSVEVERLRYLDHPHIVKLYEHYEDSRSVYLVMDFCTGGDLGDLVRKQKLARRRLTESFVADVMRQVMLAIAHVHARGIVHLDLKGLNIMLTSSRRTLPPGRDQVGATLAAIDERPHVMVIDLGVAQIFRPGNFKDQLPCGTPITMAPEVWKGEVHPKADVFSCGVVLYDLLTFTYPYKVPTRSAEEALRYWSSTTIEVDWSWETRRKKEAVSLCKKMIQIKRNSRPTAAQCLQARFLEEPDEDGDDHEPVPEKLVEMLASCHKRSILHRSVAFSIARAWPSNQLPSIKRVFQKLDVTQIGRVSVEEIQTLLRQAGGLDAKDAEEAADAVDADRDNTVCWTEFVAACIDLGDGMFNEDLRRIFDEADRDQDGFLGQRDLAGLLAAEHLRSESAVADLLAEIAGPANRLDFRTFRRHFRGERRHSRAAQGAGGAPREAPARRGSAEPEPALIDQAWEFAEWARDAVWPEQQPAQGATQVNQQELRRLLDMGFSDRRRCTEVLLRHGNKVDDFVIAELVASGEFH